MKEFFQKLKTWQKWVLGLLFFVFLINLYSNGPTTEEIEVKTEARNQRIIKRWVEDSIRIEEKKLEVLKWRRNNPKAAKIHDKHPQWTIAECESVSERKIWVGMHYDMLVYMYGRPYSANSSNYGNGIKWQWCWRNLTPSCFYDDNEDGIIDSYN